MRRFCFLLLAFLLPLQLFAAVLTPAAVNPAQAVPVMQSLPVAAHGPAADDCAGSDERRSLKVWPQTAVSEAGNLDEQPQEPDFSKTQADLEDQTLPAVLATLALDWQPFPHLYPSVQGSASAFIDLQRPPPLAVA